MKSEIRSLVEMKTWSFSDRTPGKKLIDCKWVFRKKLNKDGQMKELKQRQYYQKPSEIKREKKKEGIRRHIKDRKLKALKGEL